MRSFETLERRDCLATGASLVAGVLSVVGTKQADRVEIVLEGSSVQVTLNGQVSLFAEVSSLTVDGLKGNDYIVNRTDLPAVIKGGKGNDYLQGGSGDDVLLGGKGNDILTDFTGGGGNNRLEGGDGNDNLWGGPGPSDILLGGRGRDTLYDIVGGTNSLSGGAGKDKTIARQTDNVVMSSKDVQAFFGSSSLPIELSNGILYLTGDAEDNRIVVSEIGKNLSVSLDGQQATFLRSDVKMIGGLGSSGNDTFINDSRIDVVFYGSSGEDTLLGGRGKDILKGGADNDSLFGDIGKDDLSGDGGEDTIVGGRGKDILRTDAEDSVFAGLKDSVIG